MSLSKILLPVVFSERCRGAAQYAETLACHFHSELTLLHVVTPPAPAYGAPEAIAYTTAADLLTRRLEDSKVQLDAFLLDELRGLCVTRVVCQGDPAQTIIQHAHSGKFDLIVMPTHGYGPFRRFLLGSVTAKVLHDGDCPVWTGPHMEKAPPRDSISFHKILCAIDLGPHSREVLAWAAAMAKEFASELTVYHAALASPLTSELGDSYFDPAKRTELAGKAEARITSLLEETGATAAMRVDMRGDVPAAVRETARELAPDLLVTGRGHHLEGGRLRTNVYAIIRDAPCPVASI